jgi:predicted ester cyclase
MEEMDRGSLNTLDEFFSPDFVDHNSLFDGESGLESLKRSAQKFHAAFPDSQHVIEDLIAEGDRVVVRIVGRGTFAAEFMGIQPTGALIEMKGIAIYRITAGRIVEKWAEQDRAGMLQQLGAKSLHEELRR